jgi:hypothetical protein
MTRRLLVVLACLALAAPVAAGTLEDVTMADSVQVGDATLTLNGMGLRIKKVAFIKIKVYVAGLYLPTKTSDASAILNADEPKQLVMHFLYKEVSREKLVDAWNESFAANAKGVALGDRLDTFNGMWSDMKTGEEAVLTYVPGTGTTVVIKGEAKGVIPGADFAKALFSVWLGPEPPNKEIKEGLLGK